jgi:hypothetical protein
MFFLVADGNAAFRYTVPRALHIGPIASRQPGDSRTACAPSTDLSIVLRIVIG